MHLRQGLGVPNASVLPVLVGAETLLPPLGFCRGACLEQTFRARCVAPSLDCSSHGSAEPGSDGDVVSPWASLSVICFKSVQRVIGELALCCMHGCMTFLINAIPLEQKCSLLGRKLGNRSGLRARPRKGRPPIVPDSCFLVALWSHHWMWQIECICVRTWPIRSSAPLPN